MANLTDTIKKILNGTGRPSPFGNIGFDMGTWLSDLWTTANTESEADAAQADIDSHVDGGASKHDATEVDFELADATKRVVLTASDTVEAAITDLDAGLGVLVKAAIAVADAPGGATTALLTTDLTQLDGSRVLAAARQIHIKTGAAQYAPQALNGNVTFGTATKGSIVASGTGWCLALTDADGEFDCTVTNAADEAVFFWVESSFRASDLANACVVLGSNSDSATWSA